MRIIPGINVAVIEGDTTHAKWIEELGTIHHDPWMAEQVCRHIKPGDVVVQGGANIGTLTRAMLDAGARVVAFEVSPMAMECLFHNCKGGDLHAVMRPLSDVSDQRVVTNFDQENAGATYIELREPRLTSVGDFTFLEPSLTTVTIDSFDLSPSLILLDIEGQEPFALRGAAQTIARCHPIIICEVNRGALERAGTSDDELFALIDTYGYRWEILQPDCKRGDAQYDILCLPK